MVTFLETVTRFQRKIKVICTFALTCSMRESENLNEKSNRNITSFYNHKKLIHVKVRRAILKEIMFVNAFGKAFTRISYELSTEARPRLRKIWSSVTTSDWQLAVRDWDMTYWFIWININQLFENFSSFKQLRGF